MTIDRAEIMDWLRETDPRRLSELWRQADEVRRQNVADEVHLRGLVEISNHCVRNCWYCGLAACNENGGHSVKRYRLSREEILQCGRRAERSGYGTVVLQSGEDYGITGEWLAETIEQLKAETELAVTLSVGERSEADLALWREAGADRYLLRFETSDPALYATIHPGRNGVPSDRFAILQTLKRLGYETGSGVMIGIPGQTWQTLARDVELFAQLDLDMIGVGPYLPHPATKLGQRAEELRAPGDRQVPNTELMAYKVIALTRLVCPRTNIPSTTAVATLNNDEGRELGLERGANVIMPNVTPPECRALYEIYPGKACIHESAEDCGASIRRRITNIGRRPGIGRGDSPNYLQSAGRKS